MFADVRKREITGLESRTSWDIVSAESLPSSASVLGGRFVLTIMDEGGINEIWKVRFVG